MNKLTDKQEKFCNEYLIDLNATQAAIRSGYSEKTARQIASQFLTKLNIQERIAQLRAEIKEKTQITPESVLKDLQKAANIALGLEPHHVIVRDGDGQGGSVTTSQQLSKTDLAAFIKTKELLMRHIGMFEKDNNQKQDKTTINTFEIPKNGRD